MTDPRRLTDAALAAIADSREDALEPMDKARQAWLSQEKETMHAADRYQPLLLAKRAFAAGFAAGLAHARQSIDSAAFTCDICGQHAIIGTVSGPGQPIRKRCAEHFPEVKNGTE